jgi:hypothetical protein
VKYVACCDFPSRVNSSVCPGYSFRSTFPNP